MPLQIEYKCPNCRRTVAWIYDDEEDEMRVDLVTGCPGSDCTRVHEAMVRRVDEEEATKVKQRGYVK
jgi:DNA-directed RNA polymerase subunit RPC12/RpoP